MVSSSALSRLVVCRKLAIELAAARVRALSLAEILDGLHDRFRLLTGGARTAVRRQQTLRASVDWSHGLLSEPERVLFRRLAVFVGGFDLDAAQAVGGGADMPRFQVLDLLTLLVDKSLVVTDDSGDRTRYRLLETVRQHALEKLGESGGADSVRSRHRDYYTAMAAVLDAPAGRDYEQRLDQAEQAVAIARDVDDPALLARTLTACGFTAGLGYHVEVARACFAEAIGLARAVDDRWRLSQILAWQAQAAHTAGDPLGTRAAGEEGRDLADAIGDKFNSRVCRFYLGSAKTFSGDLAGAAAQFDEVAAEAEAAHDEMGRVLSLAGQSLALAYRGEAAAVREAAEAALKGGAELGGRFAVIGHVALGFAALAAGDGAAAHEAREAALQYMIVVSGGAAAVQRIWNAEAALADGDLAAARRWADEAVSTTTGWYSALALTVRARVAIAASEPDQAERDAHDALARATEVEAYLLIPDILECLAALASQDGSHREAARLFGAAEAIRQPMGAVRFKIWDAGYQASVAALRDALGEQDFDGAWAEGGGLSTEEAIAYAQRGRGQRKRPTSGWASLTPTERDVVRLVSDGLANNDIATRLFVSPRTVQTHLTHVYTKLGLTSRVQLAQEAARHA